MIQESVVKKVKQILEKKKRCNYKNKKVEIK